MSRFRYLLPVLSSSLLSFAVWAAAPLDDDLKQVREAFCKKLNPATLDVAKVQAYVTTQRPDGSWEGVDYVNCKNRSYWAGAHDHLYGHVLQVARLYLQRRDPAIAAVVRKGLMYWIGLKLVNPNWWQNVIAVPTPMGLAALMVDDELTDEERQTIVRAMEVTQLCDTGANCIWRSRIVMMRAILARDTALMDAAVKPIWDELVISPDDREGGIKSDWSFHQHGRQLQFGNYGMSFVNDVGDLGVILKNSRWAYPKDRLALVCRLIEEGFAWSIWKNNLDVAAIGRQFHPGCVHGKGCAILNSMGNYGSLGWKFTKMNPVGFKYFDQSAYAVYRTKSWMASVRMCTTSILGPETGVNSENMRGGHLADGALFLYRSGHEYDGIFPLWGNWRLIPGITTYLDLPPVRRNGPVNEADEIRAVGTAEKAEVRFRLKREGLTAVKGWRFTPEGIECRGVGITATNASSRVVTCVEQCFAAKDFRVLPYENGALRVVNNGFEYVVSAPEADIYAGVEQRSGDYKDFMGNYGSKVESGKVCSIWIDHGITPKDASYRYEVRILPLPATK